MEFVDTMKKIGKIKPVKIDYLTFVFHYKVTATLFLICFLAMSATTLFGTPIRCHGDKVDPEFSMQYCWTGYMHVVTDPHIMG